MSELRYFIFTIKPMDRLLFVIFLSLNATESYKVKETTHRCSCVSVLCIIEDSSMFLISVN